MVSLRLAAPDPVRADNAREIKQEPPRRGPCPLEPPGKAEGRQ